MTTDFNTLLTLCQEEKFTELEELVEDINVQDEKGDTLLLKCCSLGYDNAVKYLVKNRNNFHTPLDINKCNKDEDTPLHVCVDKGRFDMLKYLIENGADIQKEAYGTENALAHACSLLYSGEEDNNLLDIIKYLIQMGANVNSSDGQGRNSLYYACIAKNLDLIKLLLDKGADNYTGNMRYGNLFENIIHEINDRESGRMIIPSNEHDITYKEVFKFIFDNMHFSNFDMNDHSINFYSRQFKQTFRDHTRLEYIPLTIKNFFDWGIITDINKQNSEGDTLLHCSCKFGKIDNIQYLLDKGTASNPVLDKYIQNKEGKTPIDVVRELDDDKAEEILDLMFPEDRSKVKVAC